MPTPVEITRWIDARTSVDRIGRDAGAPKRIPPRRWNVYVRPSAETSGSPSARSGTGSLPSGAGRSGNASSPRYIARAKNHAEGRAARDGSRESTSSASVTRRVPPRTGVPVGWGRAGGFPGQAVSADARRSATTTLFRGNGPVVEREVTGGELTRVLWQVAVAGAGGG